MSRRKPPAPRIESLPDRDGYPLFPGDRVLIPYRTTRVVGRLHAFDPGGLAWVVFAPPGGREHRVKIQPRELEFVRQWELPLEWVEP